MRESLEQQHQRERMFMKTYDKPIKMVEADNNKVDTVLQVVNDATKLQDDVQSTKQRRMQLQNYLVTELSKPKNHYKRLLDIENDVKIYVHGFQDISTKCRTTFKVIVGIEKHHPVAKRKLELLVLLSLSNLSHRLMSWNYTEMTPMEDEVAIEILTEVFDFRILFIIVVGRLIVHFSLCTFNCISRKIISINNRRVINWSSRVINRKISLTGSIEFSMSPLEMIISFYII